MQRVLLIVLALAALAGCGAQGGGGQAAVPTAAQATAPAAPTATLTPSITPTPAPTKTPAPTRTPAPTKTPTNTPEPTATPAPVALSGKGQQVTEKITLPAKLNRIVLEHKGSRNFIVHVFKGNDEDFLVNTIGRYQGVRPLVAEEPVTFEIRADGAWSITIEPMGWEDGAAGVLSGSGDYASGFFEPKITGQTPYTFKHTGQRNFIVHLYCAGGEDFVQNTIGEMDGSSMVNLQRGPCFWEVRADGEWTIAPK